ncbi:MAG: hypothetical protein PUE12_15090 [Oscillospiraceae bacterium]|nr:hypothetical protein [Oscillospiraceae bacterium]
MSEELKIKSFRISEDTTDKFRSICADFDNQNTALSALISAYEIQNAKAVLSTRQTELEDYDVHLQALQRAFLQSLELNTNAEERIRNEFARQLDTKDKTIADYQTRIDELEGLLKTTKEKCDNDTKTASDKLSEALRDVTEANKSIDKLTSELQSVKATVQDKLAIIDGLTARIPETEKLQTELKEKDAAIDQCKSQYVVKETELNNKISELNNTITSLTSEIEKLKTAAEIAEQKHQLELEKAVIDEQKKYIDEIEKLRQEIYELKTKKADSDTADAEPEQLTF